MMPSLFATHALMPDGWANAARVTLSRDGAISNITVGARRQKGDVALHVLMPSFVNAHCHAFQRAMSGLTQKAGPGRDDFWTWREVMYGFAARMTPRLMEAIAAHAYAEMLEGGYGHVVEFHYLHHGADGAKPMAMAEAIIRAARQTGIGLTLVPVLYQQGGFGRPLKPGQKPFDLTSAAFLDLVKSLRQKAKGFQVGASFHSLRAVAPETMASCLSELRRIDPHLPIHIHAAEQTGEVDDCVAALGMRPVEYLLKKMGANASWTLVHATHMTAEETRALAASGAVAAVCPTTEGDLGDGFFPLAQYLEASGLIAVGTDSNICLSPFAELRQLEWSQRLLERRRLVAAAHEDEHAGARLVRAALAGGARAADIPAGHIAIGQRANLIGYDADDAVFGAHAGDALLDALVLGANAPHPSFNCVAGRIVRRRGRQSSMPQIRSAYAAALRQLTREKKKK
ncbi:MAG TPA: formimidoylglutamate deiminase [Micropepsaceae bacterium]|nr:formimidoylglutamate deiminase [Micropepsaceae bacterium]